jgi:hypothetical protein
MKSQEHPHTLSKACQFVDNKTTTWTNLGRNTGLRSDSPATDRLINGTGHLLLASYVAGVGMPSNLSQTCESSVPSSLHATTSIILSTKFVKLYAIYENYGSNNRKEQSWPREEQSEVW